MRILIDECVAYEIGRLLQQANHDVVFVRDVAPAAKDSEILPLGITLQRLIVTHDYDYGDIIFRDGAPSLGVFILALDLDHRTAVEEINALSDALSGSLTTIGPRRTRQRSIPAR
jgi:predicted nuclease of predicted toxin-antitoxin system